MRFSRIMMLAICLLAGLYTIALSADELPVLKWKAVPGAGGYEVEVTTLAGAQLIKETVTGNSIALNLKPGSYLYRITTLNKFLRPEASTKWTRVNIKTVEALTVKAMTPPKPVIGKDQFFRVQAIGLTPDTQGYLVLDKPEFSQDKAKAGKKYPIESLRLLSQDSAELIFSGTFVAGSYSLFLVNPPDTPTTPAFNITFRVTSPVIASVSPESIQPGVETTVTITGDNFLESAVPVLKKGNSTVNLTVVSKDSKQIIVKVNPGKNLGYLDLTVINGQDAAANLQYALTAGQPTTVEKEKAAKVLAEREKSKNPGSDKEKADKEKAAKDQADKEKAAKDTADKDRLSKEQAEKDRLAKEKADKEKTDKEAGLKTQEKIQLRYSVGLGYSYDLVLGDWSSIYSGTPLDFQIYGNAAYLFTPADSALDIALGIELNARLSFWSSTPDPLRVDSQLMIEDAEFKIYGEFGTSLIQIRPSIGCGMLFVQAKILNSPAGSPDSAYSSTFVMSAGLFARLAFSPHIAILAGCDGLMTIPPGPVLILARPGLKAEFTF